MLATAQRPATVGPSSFATRMAQTQAPRISKYDGGRFLPDIAGMSHTYQTGVPTYSLQMSQSTPWRPSTYYKLGEIRSLQGTGRPTSETGYRHRESRSVGGAGEFTVAGSNLPPMLNSGLLSRRTPQEWHQQNATSFMKSDRARSLAEKLRADAVDLCRETDTITKQKQRDTGQRLGERITDLHFWQTELNNEIDNMIFETNALIEAKRGLEKALAESENPLHIANECLYFRDQRQGIDLVHDEVERELLKEVDSIKKCQDEMRRTIDQMNQQIAVNRGIQNEMERDAAAKHAARSLDDKAHQLRNAAHGISYHHGIEVVDSANSIPDSWQQYTYDNVYRSQTERAKSASLRNDAAGVYQASTTQMWTQFNNTNSAFSARTSEAQDAKNKLQMHLSRVMQEIFDTSKNIELVKKSIKDKEAPLKVAQTRLQTRAHRPGVELCRDPAQFQLQDEVENLKRSIQILQEKLVELETTAEELNQTRLALEEELARKSNSVFLDKEKCMGMRKSFPMSTRIQPF